MYGTLISSVTVGSGGASSIDFTSIPQTYTDLILVFSGRSAQAANIDGVAVSFNGSTTGFSGRVLVGDGSASSSATVSTRLVFYGEAANQTANTFGNAQMYIPNYAGSTNKSFSGDSVSENNATAAYQGLMAGLWSNTAAITQITLTSTNSANFVQYTTAYLYGLTKGSGGATVS